MDKYLRPERLNTLPSQQESDRAWVHWKRTFQNFLEATETTDASLKLSLLINYLSPKIYEYISECTVFEVALENLDKVYLKPKNEIFVRHTLYTRKQQFNESVDEYLQALKLLSKDCDFKAVSAETYKNEMVRDAFINGLQSQNIRLRLLENVILDLDAAYTQARALESAQKNSDVYNNSTLNATQTHPSVIPNSNNDHSCSINCDSDVSINVMNRKNQKCYFCGNSRHNRQSCPARNAVCLKCNKLGHFAKVCKSSGQLYSKVSQTETSASIQSILSTFSSDALSKVKVKLSVNGNSAIGLIDTGSSDSYINNKFAKYMKFQVYPSSRQVSMADSSVTIQTLGHCFVTLQLKDHYYENVKLSILPNLCADIILGHNVLQLHESITLNFNGSQPPLAVCNLTTLTISPPSLFKNLDPKCTPIITKSRKYSSADRSFIQTEIKRLLKEDVIEPSNSPWRAQVVITSNNRHKKRMVIDFSQTINRYTQLDAYPLPRIDGIVNQIALNKVFSTIDLKDAYYQIPLNDEDKPFTAFEAAGTLYQFKRMPFGVTNGVACFQRCMDNFIAANNLSQTYAYLDDITVCGKNQAEHDINFNKFLKAAKEQNLKFNKEKSVFSTTSITLLGYKISNGDIKPDPGRLQPLIELPEPNNLKAQKRVLGLFSYYSKWIKNFSRKIKPISNNNIFPFTPELRKAFEYLKNEVKNSVVSSVDENLPFVVETDASNSAIGAVLHQGGRPVAFFSRSLNKSELNHHPVEKEAYSIIESVRHWRHYLTAKHFTLITDQKSVSFMFNSKLPGKIKNDKIQRWRLELACYNFYIVYRPGKNNAVADALTRQFCSAMSTDTPSDNQKLQEIHNSLCHPGVTRFIHFIRTKNLPYSVEDVKRLTASCTVCAECKPRYHRPTNSHLIKATQPFERLSIDFKGPLPSNSQNKYLLTVVDEFTRFPFAIPCRDLSSGTVIKCLTSIFCLFGLPMYIHSDRGASFMSQQLKTFLHDKNVCTSRTTPYNPQGNGQCEKYNSIIWKAITLACRSRSVHISNWELLLPDALHSIRSLLCTATNTTPHERMFCFPRRSSAGMSIPSWLSEPGSVLLKRHVRQSKFDPIVDEVELLEANPTYAHVKFPDGRESTVSVRDLAPRGNNNEEQRNDIRNDSTPMEHNEPPGSSVNDSSSPLTPSHESETTLRRSQRNRRPPERLNL